MSSFISTSYKKVFRLLLLLDIKYVLIRSGLDDEKIVSGMGL